MTQKAPHLAWRGPGTPVSLLAHRGGLGPWRENTVEAFAGALRAGAHGIELDVRRTACGMLVVHHDPSIPGLGFVHQLRREDLPSWVPTLDEALTVCAGATVDVEIKNALGDPGHDPSEAAAFDVLRSVAASSCEGLARSPSGVVVSSFSLSTIAALASAGAEVPLGLLVAPARDTAVAVEEAVALGCSALHLFHLEISSRLVQRVHDTGMMVVAWTVNGSARVAAMLDAGVDAIVSDDVSGSLRAMGAARM
ncbi:MAG: glycerophosphodiester phosphodiesterase [Acidimicrobiales bacterium]